MALPRLRESWLAFVVRDGARAAPLAECPMAGREESSRCLVRGLNRDEAADYVGVSPSKFDQMVLDGRMPKPKRIDRRNIWDRWSLDRAFSELPDAAPEDGWNKALDL